MTEAYKRRYDRRGWIEAFNTEILQRTKQGGVITLKCKSNGNKKPDIIVQTGETVLNLNEWFEETPYHLEDMGGGRKDRLGPQSWEEFMDMIRISIRQVCKNEGKTVDEVR